jgi:hypothetical protein
MQIILGKWGGQKERAVLSSFPPFFFLLNVAACWGVGGVSLQAKKIVPISF